VLILLNAGVTGVNPHSFHQRLKKVFDRACENMLPSETRFSGIAHWEGHGPTTEASAVRAKHWQNRLADFLSVPAQSAGAIQFQ
jgi:hypothetical protein